MLYGKGKLYVRRIGNTKADLFYPTADVEEGYTLFANKNIAIVYFGRARPDFEDYQEPYHHNDTIGSGETITFAEARDDDIANFVTLLDEDYSLDDWLENVFSHNPELTESEKKRIQKIVKEALK